MPRLGLAGVLIRRALACPGGSAVTLDRSAADGTRSFERPSWRAAPSARAVELPSESELSMTLPLELMRLAYELLSLSYELLSRPYEPMSRAY